MMSEAKSREEKAAGAMVLVQLRFRLKTFVCIVTALAADQSLRLVRQIL